LLRRELRKWRVVAKCVMVDREVSGAGSDDVVIARRCPRRNVFLNRGNTDSRRPVVIRQVVRGSC